MQSLSATTDTNSQITHFRQTVHNTMAPSKTPRLTKSPSIAASSMIPPGLTRPDQASNGPVSDENYVSQLLDQISLLQKDVVSLKMSHKEPPFPMKIEVLHVFDREGIQMFYMDEPTWVGGLGGRFSLISHVPITDVDGYLRDQQETAFVVVKFYYTSHQEDQVKKAVQNKKPLPRPTPIDEMIRLNAPEMVAAAESFFSRQPKFEEEFPKFNIRSPIPAPYIFWYHYRSNNQLGGLEPQHQQLMHLLTDWIEENYGSTYDRIDSQLSRKVVSFDTIQYLFKPGDVLVSQSNEKLEAFIAESWATAWTNQGKPPLKSDDILNPTVKTEILNITRKSEISRNLYYWDIKAWHYQYDGQFYKSEANLNCKIKLSYYEEEVPMDSINILPLQFASTEIKENLARRGRNCWSCRYNRLVSYQARDKEISNTVGPPVLADSFRLELTQWSFFAGCGQIHGGYFHIQAVACRFCHF